MAFFNLPAPLLDWADGLLAAALPAPVRLVLWAVLAAGLSMALYRALSPQARIARVEAEVKEARQTLNAFDGAFADAWPLMRHMLGASFRHIGLVIGPALLASLPVLFLLVWLSTAYGHVFPNGADPVTLRVHPDSYAATWLDGGQASEDPRIQVRAPADDSVLTELPLTAPVTVLHKWQWWNTLIGNPAGYVPEDAPLDRIEIGLPQQEILPFGPGWVRSWELLFFAVLILSSVAIKIVFRIR